MSATRHLQKSSSVYWEEIARRSELPQEALNISKKGMQVLVSVVNVVPVGRWRSEGKSEKSKMCAHYWSPGLVMSKQSTNPPKYLLRKFFL
jgi:hypothetical protein